MKYFINIALALFFLMLPFNIYAQNKINESKEELKRDTENNADENTSSHSSNNSSDDSDNIITEILAKAFLYITYYTFIGNYEEEDHLYNKLTKYPYNNNNLLGNYESSDSNPASTKTMRLDLEDKLLLGMPNLFGNHLKTKFRPFQFFYLQVDYFELFEYNKIDRSYSNLSLFNFSFCYDRIRLERFNVGWTLGANYVGNDVNRAGISFGLNTDIFLFKPCSLFSSIKWGAINNKPVNEFEIQFKYQKKRGFYCIGYEHLKIATPTYNFIMLGGGVYF